MKGIYNHSYWQLLLEDNNQLPLGNVLSSIHESLHDDLNTSTLYGNILMILKYLYTETNNAKYNKLLNVLTLNSKDSHEIYATYLSMLILNNTKGVIYSKEFNKIFPEYKSYVLMAESLLPGLNNTYVQTHALSSIIKICFQNTMFYEACKNFINLNNYKLRTHDYPDYRLNILSQKITGDFWKNIIKEFEIKNELSSINKIDQADSFYNIMIDDKYTNLSIELSKHFELAISKLLSEGNQKSYLEGGHLIDLNKLLNEIDKIAPFTQSRNPLKLNSNFTHDDSSLLESYENEELKIRHNKYNAKVYFLKDIDQNELDSLRNKSDDIIYYYLISRITERLFTQYSFSDKDKSILLNLDNKYVNCLRKKIDINDELIIKLYIIETPNELIQLNKQSKIGILSSTSMMLIGIDNWNKKWLEIINTVSNNTYLFDLSPFIHMKRTLDKYYDKISIHKIDITISNVDRTPMILIGKNKKFNSIFIIPCSEMTADIIYDQAVKKLGKDKVFKDMKLFNTYKKILKFSLQNLYEEEIVFNFKALESNYAWEQLKNDEFWWN